MTIQTYQLAPIGHVAADKEGFMLVVDEPFREALLGIEGFSHLDVLFWCHGLDTPESRQVLTCPQPYKKAPEKLGIFATRSPVRPNPIALTPVMVLAVDRAKGIVRVPYIDAEDGSPILDIKPYHPATDRVRDVKVPAWCAHWPKWYEDNATFDWAAEFVHAR